MRISEPQIVELKEILVGALSLTEMDDATLMLGRDRERITLAGNKDAIFREVVIYYNNRDRIDGLLNTARSINPTNPDLYLFEQGQGRAAQLPQEVAHAGGLEALIRPHLPAFNARKWLERAAAAENCVCLVGDGDGALGSGFLVGPDAVMTNYHVVQKFIDEEADPAELTFTFDFTFLGAAGVVYGAAVEPDGRSTKARWPRVIWFIRPRRQTWPKTAWITPWCGWPGSRARIPWAA